MKHKSNLKRLFICLLIGISMGCSNDPEFKADSIIGYWQAREELSTTKNGILSPKLIKNFYVHFLDNNCGTLHDSNENWTNDMKWAFQERTVEDILLLSIALNSNGQSSDLSFNRINYILKFEEKNFRTHAIEFDTIGNDVFIRDYITYYVRQ